MGMPFPHVPDPLHPWPQYNAKQDLILILKNISYDVLVIHRFLCDKRMAIPQIKFDFFLAFNPSVWPFSDLFLALFGFLLKFSSGNPVCNCHKTMGVTRGPIVYLE